MIKSSETESELGVWVGSLSRELESESGVGVRVRRQSHEAESGISLWYSVYQVCFKGRHQIQSLSRSLKVKVKVGVWHWRPQACLFLYSLFLILSAHCLLPTLGILSRNLIFMGSNVLTQSGAICKKIKIKILKIIFGFLFYFAWPVFRHGRLDQP